MTPSIHDPVRRVLRRAAIRAILAPSIHNTQPWRFVLGADHLDIYADWSRRLHVLDPRGRQLLISCGCALFNARTAIEAAGHTANVERFPNARKPDLLARLTVAQADPAWSALSALDPAIDIRRTNRRGFADEPVPVEVIENLIAAARAEGVQLLSVTDPEHLAVIAELSQQADRIEVEDPAYRAELRAWTTDDPRRVDGVPAAAVPYAGVGARNTDAIPIRVFDTAAMGWLPPESHSGPEQTLLLLGTTRDGPEAWLSAGEGLERVLLEITRRAFAASPLTQIIEVARTNEQLCRELNLTMYPHVLLRVGRAPETVRTRRRRLVDVLTEVG
jgi:nitroreductase